MMQDNQIEIVNADINNLKQLNVSFGLNQITLIVGRSGSGKSSLVELIIAKEGNQRLDHFLNIKDKAIEPREDLAFINKLPPTIFFGQKSFLQFHVDGDLRELRKLREVRERTKKRRH